eukprot:PhM_4_TR9658/c0_g1_i1/m.57779
MGCASSNAKSTVVTLNKNNNNNKNKDAIIITNSPSSSATPTTNAISIIPTSGGNDPDHNNDNSKNNSNSNNSSAMCSPKIGSPQLPFPTSSPSSPFGLSSPSPPPAVQLLVTDVSDGDMEPTSWTRYTCPLVGWSILVPPAWTHVEAATAPNKKSADLKEGTKSVVITTMYDPSDPLVKLVITTKLIVATTETTIAIAMLRRRRRTSLFHEHVEHDVASRDGLLRSVSYPREAAVTYALKLDPPPETVDIESSFSVLVEGFCSVHPGLQHTVDVQFSSPEKQFGSYANALGRSIMATFDI